MPHLHTLTLDNGDTIKYRIESGTFYHVETFHQVSALLEDLRKSREIVRIYYGDTKTGEVWAEENDVHGRIGRSTGEVKIPLLVPSGQNGGGGLLDHCIVAIQQKSGNYLYKHPNFHCGVWDISPSDIEGYSHLVRYNGEINARFKTLKEAQAYQLFMNGMKWKQ